MPRDVTKGTKDTFHCIYNYYYLLLVYWHKVLFRHIDMVILAQYETFDLF